MNPSSPSSADPAQPAFKVTTRALAQDLASAHADESNYDLGAVDAPGLIALLEKLAVLNPVELAEADPYLVVTGRRGRFAIRPLRGRFLLRSTLDGTQDYLELPAADVPTFLDGKEAQTASPAETPAPLTVERPEETKTALALSLFMLAALVLGFSVWFTFRPNPVDPDSDYAAITAPAEVTTLRQQAIGTYVAGSGDDERALEIDASGTAHYREFGPGRVLYVQRIGPYTLARRLSDRAPVLRVNGLGTIEVKPPDTIVFARDPYTRRTANP